MNNQLESLTCPLRLHIGLLASLLKVIPFTRLAAFESFNITEELMGAKVRANAMEINNE